jgi:hypothetical protein
MHLRYHKPILSWIPRGGRSFNRLSDDARTVDLGLGSLLTHVAMHPLPGVSPIVEMSDNRTAQVESEGCAR